MPMHVSRSDPPNIKNTIGHLSDDVIQRAPAMNPGSW